MCWSAIAARERFLLTSHARPDGDAVGSALACAEILRSLGKQADVVLSDGVPYIYRPLPYADQVIQTSLVNGHYEAAIVLECDSLARTASGRAGTQVHHQHRSSSTVGSPFGHVNWIDPDACATAEMIYRLGREAGVKITKEIATCLYTAVMTDTGSFRFAGTNDRPSRWQGTGALRRRSGAVRAGRVLRQPHLQDAAAGRGAFHPASRRQRGVDAHHARRRSTTAAPSMKMPKGWSTTPSPSPACRWRCSSARCRTSAIA